MCCFDMWIECVISDKDTLMLKLKSTSRSMSMH